MYIAYGLERRCFWCEWCEILEICFSRVLVFVLLWVGSLSASSRKCGNSHHSALILPNHWSWVINNLMGSKFHFFLELEFHVFHGFLSEFSAWSHELKWWCRILCFSVTGKAQNSGQKWENTCIQYNGQFCSMPQAHCVHLNKCITGVYGKLLRGTHFWVFGSFGVLRNEPM